MHFHRGLLVAMAIVSVTGSVPALSAQAAPADDPCVCPPPVPPAVIGERRGVSGLLGLAALGLARFGAGVRSFATEPAPSPALAGALEEDAPLPPGVVAAAPVPADTARDTTEIAGVPPVTPDAPPVTMVAAAPIRPDAAPDRPAAEQPGMLAPRTATLLPLLALLGAVALATGAALRFRRRDGVPTGRGRPARRGPPRGAVLLAGAASRSRYRIR